MEWGRAAHEEINSGFQQFQVMLKLHTRDFESLTLQKLFPQGSGGGGEEKKILTQP